MPADDGDSELGVELEWPEDEDKPAPMPRSRARTATGERTASVAVEGDAAPPQTPLLPALASRLEGVRDGVSTLGLRVDALQSTTTSFQSSLSDRLAEYMEAIRQIARAQQEMLDDYRHGNERSIAELRRTLATSDDSLRRVAARVDELISGVVSIPAPTQATAPPRDDKSGPRTVTVTAAESDVGDELEAIHEELVQLRRRVGVRARATVTLEDAQVDSLVDRVVQTVGIVQISDADLGRLAEAVVARLEEVLEVVPEEAPPADEEPATTAPSRRRKS